MELKLVGCGGCTCNPCSCDEQEFPGSNGLIKQGAKLVATGEDVGEDLPAKGKLALTPAASPESGGASSASLFPDEGLPPHKKRILSRLKAEEGTMSMNWRSDRRRTYLSPGLSPRRLNWSVKVRNAVAA